MNANDTARTRSERLRTHAILSAVILGIGLVLLVYMIVVEDEPGALPLGLVVVGLGWQIATRVRMRAAQG
ncbi:MAG TPA: hypothetical protein VK610_10055 [Rhodothermales bacterium]|nr:hypothetical protein [Rhodothermales bacterium]